MKRGDPDTWITPDAVIEAFNHTFLKSGSGDLRCQYRTVISY